MGAEQSLENRAQSPSQRNVQSTQSSSASVRDQPDGTTESGSTTNVKLDATSTSKDNQIAAVTYEEHTPTISPTRHCYTTATTPSSTQDTSADSPYPFREKVKHLPPALRKEKYEEEIYRLFRSPHPSHFERLAPVKIQTEKADLPLRRRNTAITWNETQLTYDIGKGALIQRSYKRCNRSKPDPWRRYGALRKLHEIGGTGCTPPNQVGPRAPQRFYRIEPGSNPPPPPNIPPITTIEEYGTIEELIAPKRKKTKAQLHRKAENNQC